MSALESTSTGELEDAAQDAEALRGLVVDCPELRELEKLLGHFNLFEVLRLEHHEIRHSNILRWLLDPEENHGLRDLFLRRWLMRVFHENTADGARTLDPVDIDSSPIKSVKISREWAHIDLLIEIETSTNETWVIAIENKIFSSQHSNQLSRYREKVESVYSKAKKAFILLSVGAEEPDDTAYVVATYDQLQQELDRCLQEHRGVLGDEPRMIIEHYIDAIKRHFMPDSPIQELALKIYRAHRRALDIIFEHRPDTVQLLTDAVAELAKSEGPSVGITYSGSKKGIIYLMPKAWGMPSNQASAGGAVVWCEINFYYIDRLVFKAISGPTNIGWKSELFEMSTKVPFKNTQRRKSLPDLWFQFYGVTTKELNLADVESDNADEVARNIWRWSVEQMGDKSFAPMVDMVASLLSKHPLPPEK